MQNNQVRYVLDLRDQFSTKMATANNSVNRFEKSMGGMIGRFVTFAAIGGVLINSVKKIADFEEAISNLSAITGATGEDLEFYKSKAIEMGKATTKSSIETVQAFKLIASAKPELLSNKEALAATTKEAIALSEASGLTLPEAAMSLTSALNQFNLSADQSSRVINVLAAGSKWASAEIPDLAASLKEFGGIAESLSISVEQAAASVETLSAKDLKGQRAGMMLRNVFLKLGASTDRNLNPKIVGLSTALKNLAPIQDDVTELTKMFGRQNVIAAQTLIKERSKLDDLTVAMTGTNIAYEQASINTNNLNSDIKRLGSAWEGFILNLNKGEGGISKLLRNTTQGLTALIDKLDELNKTASEIGKSKAQTAFEKTDKYYVDSAKSMEDKIKVTEDLIKSYQGTLGSLARQRRDLKNPFTIKTKRREIDEQTEKFKELIVIANKYRDELINPKKATTKVDPILGSVENEDLVTKITAASPKVFNINIQKITGIETVNTTTMKEGAIAAGNLVKEELQIALADLQLTAG